MIAHEDTKAAAFVGVGIDSDMGSSRPHGTG